MQQQASGRDYKAVSRESALAEYYNAERRAGANPVEANERMADYAKRLDALEAGRAT